VDMKEYLRRRKEGQPLPQPAPVPPTPAAPAPKKKAEKPPCTPSVECAPSIILTHRCGHKIGAASIQGSNCPACVAVSKKAKAARRAESRKAKNPEKAHGSRVHTEERLPDNAAFVVRYEAATRTWAGTLTIPGFPIFDGAATGVFKLLVMLDRQYREHADASPHAVAPEGAQP
jgi:hypothetical protein